jgi:hypothetical protein
VSATAPGGLDELVADLREVMAAGVASPLPDDRFRELALRAFRVQYEGNDTYRAFCRGRDRTPDGVQAWEEVPPVPTTAFKHLDLVVGEAADAERTFRTSGTSRGRGLRGRHHVPRLELYHASLLPPFLRWVLHGVDGPPLLSLVPSPEEVPDSSLAEMVGTVARGAAGRVQWLAAPDGAPRRAAFVEAAREASAAGDPVLVVGTAFAFVHLLDHLAGEGRSLRLPDGSRIMETGGFKGRSRAVSRTELYRGLERLLAVPGERVVNEYGMTELLSQLYEPVLHRGVEARGRHVPPPWLRVRALDPATLEPLPPGRPGLLAFYDLANAGSVSAILTEDVGSVNPEGVRLEGRAPGAEPRGCSLALEDLLEAAGSGGDPA